MFSLKHYGDVAQLGEHLHGMQGVKGSSPFISTTEIDTNSPLEELWGAICFVLEVHACTIYGTGVWGTIKTEV